MGDTRDVNSSRLPLQHVSIHGHSVGYRRGGSGQKILLIHGLAGSSKTWDDVIPLVTPHADVIAVDLLGHGESAKPTGDYSLGAFASGLRDFLSILGIESVTIVGHSFGGGVAMQLAYQHPNLVDRLVLVGSGGLGREVSWLLRLLTLPGAEYVMPFAFPKPLVDRATDVGRHLGRRNIRSPRLAEMWRAYSSLAGATNRKAFVRTMRGVIEPTGQTVNASDRLYLAAHVPTMIVWGDQDGIIPVTHAHAAHELIPTSRLEIMKGIGHFPHVEQPGAFADLLVDFVESTEVAAARHEALRDVLLEGA
jgi:pimeloyl-ACP methyl ester carboxylesterase